MSERYIGLMSGTSMDAIDCALVEFKDQRFKLLATLRRHYPTDLNAALHQICQPGNDEINQLGQLDRQVGCHFAATCNELLAQTGYTAADIAGVGSHGQTIRHQPHITEPFTLQIGDPNIIAEQTGITTVADFRRRDMSKGGQGAPLTPSFHQFAFSDIAKDRFIVNIGGIANITFLPAGQTKILGFDSGPGNTLLDHCCRQNIGQPYDRDGGWAKQGVVITSLLQRMQSDPYFKLAFPKSTGREYFNADWLTKFAPADYPATDIQATLAQLTAWSIADAINSLIKRPAEIYLCGGGVYNHDLVNRLSALLDQHQVATTAALGMDPEWVEAIAFAWLARQTLMKLPGNVPEVTGAAGATILGGVYFGNC